MLWIKYQVVQSTVGEEDVLVNKKIGYSEANIAIAEAEAYNGKYEVVEDDKSYNDEPLAIEFGGTGAKTAAEALQKIGAAPAGYVAYTGWFNSDDMLTTKLTEAYAGIADNKIGFAELESTSNTIILTQGKWFFTMHRSSAEYGVVTAIRYDSANVVAIMQRSLIGGTWGAWKNGSPSAFAPAGYGLGTSAKELTSADNLDNIWQNGNYFWNWSAPTNAPVFDGSTQGAYGYMRVDCKDNGTYTQTIRSAHVPNIGITVIRTRIGDAIIEEWENPPMALGVEYRTTERWNGKAVYTCLVNCGSVARDGITSTYLDLNITQSISCEACSTTGDSFPVKWVDTSDIYVNAYANKTAIHVYTSGGYSTTATIYAKLRYTKD